METIYVSEQSLVGFEKMTAAEREDVFSALYDVETKISELLEAPVRVRVGDGPSWDTVCGRLERDHNVGEGRLREIIEKGLAAF